MEGLDQLMSAEQERPQGKRFVHKERLQGHYRLEGVRLAHGDSPPVVDVQALNIRAGERVALLGGNGAGKSTCCACSAACSTRRRDACCWTTSA